MISFFKLNITFALLLVFTVTNCISQDSATSAKIKYYTQKVEKYLDKEKALSTYYSINANGISIYGSLQKKLKGEFEFRISWNKIDDFNLYNKNSPGKQVFETYINGDYDKTIPFSSYLKIDSSTIDQSFVSDSTRLKDLNYDKTIPFSSYLKSDSSTIDQSFVSDTARLKGLKIAIDPGHIAGDMEMGDIEKKCLTFKCDSLKGLMDSVAIAEGVLTFATAKLLKDKLEAEGVEVFMTRPFNSSSAFGVTFDDWLKTNYVATVDSLFKVGKLSPAQKQFFLSSRPTKRDKFRVIFKDVELAKRSEIINNYNPDLTIIIHYNVDETNTGWVKPADNNFNMVFVGGAFMKNDLPTPQKRFEFLRLLITNDLEKSIALSSDVIQSFEKNLNVKTATIKDATYLLEGCLSAGEVGVYCRNLQLTRFIHGPLVYGETLYQDNMIECIALNKECDKTKNLRVQQVAEAYFQGVLNYVKRK
ncbi:MAG: N-acetylmuramoyl-L-alanine amidase [Bacteroidota bacterium]|nr:N-acetylmuramoyl-L-alanine amidase [Bacteroidota bacterium]